jgi:hypothetical protein
VVRENRAERLRDWTERVAFMEENFEPGWQQRLILEEPSVPTENEINLLLADIDSLKSENRETLVALHNYSVSVLRKECLLAIKQHRTLRVRPDLELPIDWHTHYENLYQAQLPLLILPVVQHAFIGNPLEGELYEWSNRKALLSGPRPGNKTKLVGAAAIGAVAALLLGN